MSPSENKWLPSFLWKAHTSFHRKLGNTWFIWMDKWKKTVQTIQIIWYDKHHTPRHILASLCRVIIKYLNLPHIYGPRRHFSLQMSFLRKSLLWNTNKKMFFFNCCLVSMKFQFQTFQEMWSSLNMRQKVVMATLRLMLSRVRHFT